MTKKQLRRVARFYRSLPSKGQVYAPHRHHLANVATLRRRIFAGFKCITFKESHIGQVFILYRIAFSVDTKCYRYSVNTTGSRRPVYNVYSCSVFTPSSLVDVVFASFCGMLEIASEDSARKMIHCINGNKFDRKII